MYVCVWGGGGGGLGSGGSLLLMCWGNFFFHFWHNLNNGGLKRILGRNIPSIGEKIMKSSHAMLRKKTITDIKEK